MKHNILGIDISKAKFDVALLASGGQQLAEFTNDAAGFKRLNKWVKRHQARQVHACLEATGRYGEDLALQLYGRGHKVSVVNPLRIKRYAASKLQRNKTDREDAQSHRRLLRHTAPAALDAASSRSAGTTSTRTASG